MQTAVEENDTIDASYENTQAQSGPDVPAELFVSDIHGEYEAFAHVMRGGCGAVRQAVDAVFAGDGANSELGEAQRRQLTTLICYPREKSQLILANEPDGPAWVQRVSSQLLLVLAHITAKRMPAELAEACEGDSRLSSLAQALTASPAAASDALRACVEGAPLEDAVSFVVCLCEAISRRAVGSMHMVGDVYDRGPSPDLVMDELERWPKLDVQWGNHDMLWMGAALGQAGCVANAVRICARYGNLPILRDTYGIDISPLEDFARTAYANDPCVAFACKGTPDGASPEEIALAVKVQKAIAIIQFKAEAQLIAENPSFGLESRNLLDKIDYEAGTVVIDGVTHELLDRVFPTIDPADPYRMTEDERRVLEHLQQAFVGCERLQRHVSLFLEKGSLYKKDGDILLFHACVPLNADGSFKEVSLFGEPVKGRALFDAVEAAVRDAFCASDPVARKRGLDLLWYLWLGEGSPLFAKSKMATFELYLVADKAARKEVKNPFYTLLENEDVVKGMLEDFGMDPERSRIVCGHVPVKVKDGEDPVKCNGKVLIIDGGMSRAYQSTTGLAGFALRKDAEGLALAYLEPFCGTKQAIEDDLDLAMDWRQL